MKKRTAITTISTVTVAMALIGGMMLSQASAQTAPPPTPIKVEVVKEADFTPTDSIVGTVFSRSHIQLTAAVSGQIEWVAEPGTFISQGEDVAQIDRFPLELQQAEQRVQIQRAKINLDYLLGEVERLKTLALTNSTSKFQLDQTQSQYDLAAADLEIAKLKLRQIEDQLNRSNVKAPFDGVVTERLQRAGSDVNRSDVLVKFLDTENLEVHLFAPVKYLGFAKPGTSVVLRNDGLSFDATVNAVIPAADPRSQTFEMRITLPEQAQQIWAAGQHVKVQLPTHSLQQAIAVHRDALILRREGTFVVVIDENNQAKRLPVTVGRGQGDWVSVVGELKQGDKVAIRGAERLRDGQSVVIQ